MGMQIGEATVENSMEIPKKTKIELPCDPAIPLLVIYLRETKILPGTAWASPEFLAPSRASQPYRWDKPMGLGPMPSQL